MSSRPCRPNPVFLTPLVGRGRGIALRRRWLFRDALDFAEAEARKAHEAEKADLAQPEDFSDDEFVILDEPEPTVKQMPSVAACPKTAEKVKTLVEDVAEATRGIRLMKNDLDNFAAAVNKWCAEVEARETRLKNLEKEVQDLKESISRLTFLSDLTGDAVIKLLQTK